MNNGDIVSFTSLDLDIQGLIKESTTAREYSYAPYSKFKVGAAILSTDGRIFRGCNVENMSYPVGICAERTAITKAVSEGSRNFKAIAVVADQVDNIYTTPCGMCRQTVIEFGNITVYCTTPNMKEVLRTTISDLIPFAFKPQNM